MLSYESPLCTDCLRLCVFSLNSPSDRDLIEFSLLFRNSLTTSGEDDEGLSPAHPPSSNEEEFHLKKHVSDLKGRYYYEKFKFSPLDAEKHIALRKSYIEGLVWNLQYYYKGCPSWDWYYPYHYGKIFSFTLLIFKTV